MAVGFSFGRGGFRARDWTKGFMKPGVVADFSMDSPPDGFVGAELGRVGLPLFALDLREAKAEPLVAPWVLTPHEMRWIGGAFRHPRHSSTRISLASSFDLLLFVDEASAARPSGARGD